MTRMGAADTRARPMKTAAAPPPGGAAVPLHYAGTQPLSLRGPVTGRVYYFGAGTRGTVEGADVDALLRTGLFERS